MSKRQAHLVITKELVLQAADLPAGTEIVDVCISRDTPNAIDIVLAHPDFPVCLNGEAPQIKAKYETVLPMDGGERYLPYRFTNWDGLPEPVETPNGP